MSRDYFCAQFHIKVKLQALLRLAGLLTNLIAQVAVEMNPKISKEVCVCMRETQRTETERQQRSRGERERKRDTQREKSGISIRYFSESIPGQADFDKNLLS